MCLSRKYSSVQKTAKSTFLKKIVSKGADCVAVRAWLLNLEYFDLWVFI